MSKSIEKLNIKQDTFSPYISPSNKKPLVISLITKGFNFVGVVMDGIEPPTQGFSVLCSTD
jgi:hypothetical protein